MPYRDADREDADVDRVLARLGAPAAPVVVGPRTITFRLWRAIMLLFLASAVNVAASSASVWRSQTAIDETLTNRAIGVKSRMLGCLNLLLDNDRTFGMPPLCLAHEVVVLYPPTACPLLGFVADCGRDALGP